MNNDLISREDLKEALAKEIKTNDLGLWLKILSVIDNVPTNMKEAIANGTPYNPSGDCISREALIKKLEEMANNEWNIQVGSSKGLEDAIDVVENAETVEPERTQCNQIVWEQGYECGYHQAKEDVIRRIKEQYNEHHELIPCWLSVGDLKGGAE